MPRRQHRLRPQARPSEVKWWVLAAIMAGCEDKGTSASALRVPLPEGWVATGSNQRLLAGPRGSPVISLESKLEVLPLTTQLVEAVEAQNARVIQPLEGQGFVGVRYLLETQEAFVSVKKVGARTVWCASLHGANEVEVVASIAMCRDIESR